VYLLVEILQARDNGGALSLSLSLSLSLARSLPRMESPLSSKRRRVSSRFLLSPATNVSPKRHVANDRRWRFYNDITRP